MPFGSALPQDVVGVVMEFFSNSLCELHQGPVRVCAKWHSAFIDHEPLWKYFCKQRWPKTARANLTLQVYRQRITVERKCAPLAQPQHLTEIENCGFEFAFKCPMVAEMLRDTGLGKDRSKPILHCDGCDKHVYTCTTEDEVAENASLGRCVRFKRPLAPNGKAAWGVQCIILYETDTEKVAAATLQRNAPGSIRVRPPSEVESNSPSRIFSPTLNPLAYQTEFGYSAVDIAISVCHIDDFLGELIRMEKDVREWGLPMQGAAPLQLIVPPSWRSLVDTQLLVEDSHVSPSVSENHYQHLSNPLALKLNNTLRFTPRVVWSYPMIDPTVHKTLKAAEEALWRDLLETNNPFDAEEMGEVAPEENVPKKKTCSLQ